MPTKTTSRALSYDKALLARTHYDTRLTTDADPVRVLSQAGRNLFAEAIAELGPPLTLAPSISTFITDHAIPDSARPGPATWETLLLNVLALHSDYVFSREDLTAIKRAIQAWYLAHPEVAPRPRALSTDGDVIQHVNKSGQWGLKHQKAILADVPGDFYRLRAPFTYLPHARLLQRRVSLSPSAAEHIAGTAELTSTDQAAIARAREIAKIKSYHLHEFVNVPDSEWDEGHRDPADSTPSLVQPRSYQRPRRDKFKFDDYGMVLNPTVSELLTNLDRYYTPDEARQIMIGIAAITKAKKRSPKKFTRRIAKQIAEMATSSAPKRSKRR